MRAIRAACRAQGLDDDARHELQAGMAERGEIGTASMATMTLRDLGHVLDHLNRGRGGPFAHRAPVGKIRALWWSLYWLGAVRSVETSAIDAFVRRQTGIAALRFLDHRKAAAVVEALKDWLTREGVLWPDQPDALADRRAVFAAILDRIEKAGADAEADRLLIENRLDTSDAAWGPHEWDAAIRLLGKFWRQIA